MSAGPVVYIAAEGSLAKTWQRLVEDLGISSVQVRLESPAQKSVPSPGCYLIQVNSVRESDGLHVCVRWREIANDHPVLVVTSSTELHRLIDRMSPKNLTVTDEAQSAKSIIEQAIRLAQDHLLRCARTAAWTEISQRFEKLSKRDLEILTPLLNGVSNKTIAQQLGITERAIEMRRAALAKRLLVQNHSELVRLVTRYEVYLETGEPISLDHEVHLGKPR